MSSVKVVVSIFITKMHLKRSKINTPTIETFTAVSEQTTIADNYRRQIKIK